MCSNVSDKSLTKRSSSFFGLNEIAMNFDDASAVITRSQKHKKLSSVEDENKVVKDLRSVRPFLETPGRQLKRAPNNPIFKLNMDDIMTWIKS